jgi:hypothetical protein
MANGGSSESLSTVASPSEAPYVVWGWTTGGGTGAVACVGWGRGEGSLGEAWGDCEAAAADWYPVAPERAGELNSTAGTPPGTAAGPEGVR